MVRWTIDQQEAISTKDKKIIVSAAAGSGKTAVLSERVISYILNGGNINKLLIVTFTKLAANEMKERIKDNISKALLSNKNDEHLKNQLLIIEDAKIMTMDAFYNLVVKENFYRLNIRPDFEIIDEKDYQIIKENLIRKIIREKLSNKDIINELLDNFNDIKEGKSIENIVIKMSDFINKFPHPKEVLKTLNSNYDNTDFNKTIWGDLFYEEITDYFTELKTLYEDVIEESLLDDNLVAKLIPFINEEIKYINLILSYSLNKDYLNIRNSINNIKFSNFPTIKGYTDEYIIIKTKNIRDNFKKTIKNYQDTITKYSQEEFAISMKKQKQIITLLSEITISFLDELKKIQKEKNCFGFDDIPHLVIELFIDEYDIKTREFKKSSYAKEYENNFDEILIDEFQDTNYIQHLIFKAISKDEKNLFIVGDVKQSIYSFRSARSEILNNEKINNKNNNDVSVINLSQNFRSRHEVIDFCNFIFSKVMNKKFGEIIYDNSEKLNLGANYLDNNDNFVELSIITDNEELDDDNDLRNIEKEASFVAQRIKKLFTDDYQVYDNKNNVFRKLRLNDIAILLRSVNPDANIFKDALISYGIDVYTETSTVYFDNYEIELIISFLKVINDINNDVALTALLRSPIYNFSADELVQLRIISKDNHLFDNLVCINNEKALSFINKINDYKKYNETHDLNELLNYIYDKENIMFVVSSFDNSEARIKNLLQMLNHAINYTKNNSYYLNNFIDYLETLMKYDLSLEGANPASSKDSVLITTIHKSKGLEFPIVFLPHLEKKFNKKDVQNDILFDFDYLLGFKIRDYDNYTVSSNLNYELIKKYKLKKQLSEELRVLYVALTRAKEKLILSAYVNNIESKCQLISSLIGNNENINNLYLKGVSNYIDLILPVLIKSNSGNKLRDLCNIDTKIYTENIDIKIDVLNGNDYHFNKKDVAFNTNINLDKVITNLDIEDNLNVDKIKENITATELKKDTNINLPKFKLNEGGFLIGNLYHEIMEKIEFNKYENEIQLYEEINRCIKSENINKIDIDKIFSFFNSNIYINQILKNTNYHEHKIYFETEYNKITNDKHDDKIIVDGIIDLLSIGNNEAIIIDFKSDVVSTEIELVDKYKKQLDLYEIGIKDLYNLKIEKYIYSFYLKKFIKL